MPGSVREIDPDRCAVCNDRITAPNPLMFCGGICCQSMNAQHSRMQDRLTKENGQ